MFLERLRATPEQQWFWSGEERSHVIAALRSIPVQSHTKMILFSDVDIYIGAVTIDGKVVLEHPFEIWDVVGNDLMLSSPSIGDGLCLEFNIYGRNKTEYELSLWGRFSLPEANVAGASRVSMYQ
jgi:hypothetical protein